MGTFINVGLGGSARKRFIWKHLLFSFIWILIVSTLVFRIDVYIINSINKDLQWVPGILPIILIFTIIFTILLQKWYYSVALIFYPILIVFWFLPKIILDKGKIYLFGHYVNYIYLSFKNFKRTIIHYSAFVVFILLLLLTDSQLVRVLSIFGMTYFYVRFVYGYLKSSFKPAQLFGSDIENALEKLIEEREHGDKKWILSITKNTSEEEKLPEEEQKRKQLTKLVMWNFALNYLSKNLSGFKGKKAYVLSWSLQLGYFLLVSIAYFTFANFQLFKISPSNFSIQETPNLFEFIYYTLKSITFNGLESIKPNTIPAKLIEIASFLVIGIFILVIVFSVIFSLKQDNIKENVKLAVEVCNIQNQHIINHIQTEFGLTAQAALKSISDIKKSVDDLKGIFDKLF